MAANILLLEDDVPVACEIQAALAQIGCNVEIVRDGNVGLARAVSNPFDLVVASLELPGMNGFRLCNRLKKDPTARAMPVFLTTRQTSSAVFDEHRKLSTRAESYFHKPLMMYELVARVRATLSGGAPPIGATAAAPESDVVDDSDVTLVIERPSADAPAAPEKADAAKAESFSRLQREVDHWKARALAQGQGSGATPGISARDEIALREQLVKKNTEITKLRMALEGAAHTEADLRHQIQGLETERPLIQQSLHEQTSQNARLEKQLASARADKEQATRRAVDLARRFERVRPDIEQAEQTLAQEQEARRAEASAYAQSLAELRAEAERDRARAARDRKDDNDAQDSARELEVAALTATHQAEMGALQQELSDLSQRLEGATTALVRREQELADDKSREVGILRAEHLEALAVARRGFEHQQAVARNQYDAAFGKLKSEANTRIRALNAKLAQISQDAARKVAATEEREGELGRERSGYEEALTVLRREHAECDTRRIEEVAQALARARSEAGEELSAQLDRQRSEQEEALAAAQKRLDERLQVVRAEAVEQIAQSTRQYQEQAEAEKSARRRERAAAVASLEASRAGKTELERTVADLRKTLAGEQQLRAESEQGLSDVVRQQQAELVQLKQAQEAAMVAARDRARSEATVQAQAEHELELGQAMDALRAEFEKDRAQGIALMERTHTAALRQVMDAGERERANLMSRAAKLAQELDEARAEVAALEAEISALRNELASAHKAQPLTPPSEARSAAPADVEG